MNFCKNVIESIEPLSLYFYNICYNISMQQRVYIDTSVIGGCFDEEFSLWSIKLFEDFQNEKKIAVIADLTKGLRNNNFTFSHLIFGASLFDPQSQNPRNSDAITAVLLNRIEQI